MLLIIICLAFASFISSVSPCMIFDNTPCTFSPIICSVSLMSSGNPLMIREFSKAMFSILFSCCFMWLCSAVSCWTFLLSLEFSSLRPFNSTEWDCTITLFSTAMFNDVWMTLRASLIDMSMVDLMLLFSHSSISDISWSLLVVIFSLKHSSIFIILRNIAMVALLESTLESAIVSVLLFSLLPSIETSFPVVGSLGGFRFFVAGVFSPVDLLLFFPFNSVLGLDVGDKVLSVLLGRVVGDCPISTVNWLIWGCSSGFVSLIFLPLLDVDMICTAGVVIILPSTFRYSC